MLPSCIGCELIPSAGQTIEKFNKRTVRVTKEQNEDCKKLLRLMGMPVVEAPCEAEAQCAELAKGEVTMPPRHLTSRG